ncbi:tRNA (34-2'-O)-methyltransferase regulator WDR6 [Haematobia irritans]|uniref:tRNA (34-2'-O)-methyltransferase regulator WDR6 n=1 Tax=Haematobia irritans TaxID=7368 RepID=UPI003F50871E
MGGRVVETIVDGIAIEILNENSIITGKGNELHLYTKAEYDLATDKKVLDIKLTNKIHGIHKHNNGQLLLVYGEKEFVLLTKGKEHEFVELYRATLSDWISCGCFLSDMQQVILLTAHSVILRFDYDVREKTCILVERYSCTDKSTLYCALLQGSTWNDLVVFAGNAFGELLIWQPSQNNTDPTIPAKPKISPLLHRISAHNGVIFSIDYDKISGRLITTSDDRAVKWWNVRMNEEPLWNHCILKPVASGYGHISRVFKGRIIRNGSNVYALSVGEDSYFCLWRSNGELLFKRRQQYGATIWNFTYDEKSKTIYTIGSLGNMVAYDLSYELERDTQTSKSELLLPLVNEMNPKEYIAKVKFLNDADIVGITNENRLMKFSLEEGQEISDNFSKWEFVKLEGMNFKCTVMEIYENRIAICGYKRLLLIEWNKEKRLFEKLLDEELLEGVIHECIFFSLEDFIVCDSKGNCLLHLESLNMKRKVKLPQCKEPWITTALLVNNAEYLMATNRLGNLLLYKLSNDLEEYELCDTIKHIHGNLGATQLHVLSDSNKKEALIQSSGHDGSIKIFSIDFEKAKMQFCSKEIVPLSCVEYIYRGSNDQDLFLGFNDSHFVVWSRDSDVLIKLDCGGGHRCWHFRINQKDNEILLIFIKNKRVKYHRMPLINKGLLALPQPKRWHTSPCNTVDALIGDNNGTIIVSAGDDNLIKIHSFAQDNNFILRKELHNHISNIRSLKLMKLKDSNEFLIFSGGGRAQLCVSKVNSHNFHVVELQNYTLKPIVTEDISSSPKQSNNKKYKFNPETRLMSIDIKVVDNNGSCQLFIGCSDGYIRLLNFQMYSYDSNIELVSQYFCNRCILQVKYISEYDHILAADTKGSIYIFNTNLELIQGPIRIQDGGINGISTKYDLAKNSLKIFSSGDDQLITYTTLDTTGVKPKQSHFWKLHTSQICAAVISPCGNYGYTSGVDQWLYKLDLQSGEILDSFYSCVADIKGICRLHNEMFLIYGCGLQIFAFTQ